MLPTLKSIHVCSTYEVEIPSIRGFYTSLLHSWFSSLTLVAWNQPRWEYLHHGNWHRLHVESWVLNLDQCGCRHPASWLLHFLKPRPLAKWAEGVWGVSWTLYAFSCSRHSAREEDGEALSGGSQGEEGLSSVSLCCLACHLGDVQRKDHKSLLLRAWQGNTALYALIKIKQRQSQIFTRLDKME